LVSEDVLECGKPLKLELITVYLIHVEGFHQKKSPPKYSASKTKWQLPKKAQFQ
jgi:hypothetical protein